MKMEVDTQRLRSSVKKLSNVLSDIQKEQKALLRAMEELDTTWTGPAREAFRAQVLSDNEMVNKLTRNLMDGVNQLDNARNEYDSCEQDAVKLIRSISI